MSELLLLYASLYFYHVDQMSNFMFIHLLWSLLHFIQLDNALLNRTHARHKLDKIMMEIIVKSRWYQCTTGFAIKFIAIFLLWRINYDTSTNNVPKWNWFLVEICMSLLSAQFSSNVILIIEGERKRITLTSVSALSFFLQYF